MASLRVRLHTSSRTRLRLTAMLAFALVMLLRNEAQGEARDPQHEIQIVLDQQIEAWNRGDVAGFMAGYWNSPDLIYLSNKKELRGWQTLLDRYIQMFQPPNADKMGILSLPEEHIVMLGRDSAIVWGTYLVRTSDGKARGGLYTLAMRNLPPGWRTVYDRTSVEQEPEGAASSH